MILRLAKSLSTTTVTNHQLSLIRLISTAKTTTTTNDDNWNDAWETAWLPTTNSSAPTTDFPEYSPLPSDTDIDPDTKAFISDMNDNWDNRRRKPNTNNNNTAADGAADGDAKANKSESSGGLYSLENIKRDYRLKKQRIHAGLWVKEINKLEEMNLGASGDTNDIDKLLDSCSEIFDSASSDINNPRILSTSEFKNKPDGWETMSKSEDGSVWELSQREEDILLQEFERRMAFCKVQIASFIKTHIFSRRRPIDGWKYMIEIIGPNASRGKGSVSRVPSLTDSATQAFKEDRRPTGGGPGGRLTSPKRR